MQAASEKRLMRRLKLRKVEVDDLSLRRVACGRGFTVRDSEDDVVSDPLLRARIAGLVIPPAWRDVRIANDERAHIQAVGRDEASRLQYIYHPDWEQVRAARKADRLRRLGAVLPGLRTALAGHLRDRQLSPASVAAAAVTLIDRAALRAGHEAYAGDEGGRGAATLLKRHARAADGRVELDFPGKGGRRVVKAVPGRRLAAKVAALKAVPGPRLFKARNGAGLKMVTAEDLNDYLKSETGSDVTAKDFRTFHASALAIERFCEMGPEAAGGRRKAMASVCREVADFLQNTPAVCRSSYIHATVLDAFADGELAENLLRGRPRRGLSRSETALMRFLDGVPD